MEKNFIEQRRVCQKNYLLLTVDFFGGERNVFQGYEISFEFSLQVPVAILRHVFVYFAQEKNSSFFFFFSKVEKHEFT